MTAIAGMWHIDRSPGASAALHRMLDALTMYGGDRRAHIDRDVAALGICLMRLLPEDEHDRQPLMLVPGQQWMVADVRLDNRDELIRELGLTAHDAREQSDAQVLGAAWLRWDEQCLHHLVGAFGFAVWDCARPRLFMARDHSGQRPLFFHLGRTSCAFASMPKALMSLPALGATLDEEQLALHIALSPTPAQRTLFAGIDRLPPAHCLRVTAEAAHVMQYWHPDDAPEVCLRSNDDYLDAFHERMDRAVGAQLRSITPVSSHLSGGLDSSSITATAARLLNGQGQELLALTAIPRAGLAGERAHRFGDESSAAAAVAALYSNIRHRCVGAQSYSFLQVIRHNLRFDDRPVFNPTNGMWLNAIRDVVHEQGIRVLLVGEFGNATISYAGMNALSEWFRRGQWWTLASFGTALLRNGNASVRGILSSTLRPSLPLFIQRLVAGTRNLDFSLVHPDLARRMRLQQRTSDGFLSIGTDSRAAARALFQRTELAEWHTGARAGWRIDERDPTRDRRIIEFCFGIPAQQFLTGGQTRSLVRRGMRGQLPPATLARRDRGQQSADWHLSVAAERSGMTYEMEQIETSPIARRCLDLPRMRALIEHWPTVGFERREVFGPWHHALTRGLSVGHFIRRFDPEAATCEATGDAAEMPPTPHS